MLPPLRFPLQNYRKSSRHLAPFISKFVQFTHKYITCNAPAAVAFLQIGRASCRERV